VAGRRAQELKLVDRIGGLEDAVNDARERVGTGKHRRVKITEHPERELISFGNLSPSPISLLTKMFAQEPEPEVTDAWRSNYEWRVFRAMAEQPGKPLFMIPPEDIPKSRTDRSGSLAESQCEADRQYDMTTA